MKRDLSPRERVVLQMLWDGLQNKEIAHVMSISLKTVESYRHHIYMKLGVTSSMQLARYAIEHGLVVPNKVSV